MWYAQTHFLTQTNLKLTAVLLSPSSEMLEIQAFALMPSKGFYHINCIHILAYGVAWIS